MYAFFNFMKLNTFVKYIAHSYLTNVTLCGQR